MEMMDVTPQLGLYLSVPFCRAKCSFCNFASGVGSGAAMALYVDQLCAEISGAPERVATWGARLPRAVDTVYFGGGTPSLLEPEQLERIFAALHEQFVIANDAEITLEAAPGQIADPLLLAAMRLGVNRVSLGVQSFIDSESAAVGRLHTGRSCIDEIVRLRAAGIDEVSADLIAGLPQQTLASFQQSLELAAGVGLTHLSLYMFEVDEDSRLGAEVLVGGARFHAPEVPSEELAAAMYELACDWLPQHGFIQYEISNFALQGAGQRDGIAQLHRSRHNSKYWTRAPYLGVGLDAHSMLPAADGRAHAAVRFANPDELRLYTGRAGAPGCVRIEEREAFEETMFLGLRMCEGVSRSALRQAFAAELVAPLEQAAAALVEDGLLRLVDDRWQLTMRGRLISNDVFAALLDALPAEQSALRRMA